LKALRLCDTDGTPEIFTTSTTNERHKKRGIIFDGHQSLLVLLLRLEDRKKTSDLAADFGGKKGMVHESRVSVIVTFMRKYIAT
jgi:hypothetical protein